MRSTTTTTTTTATTATMATIATIATMATMAFLSGCDGSQCHSLYDCPGALVCSADARCVERGVADDMGGVGHGEDPAQPAQPAHPDDDGGFGSPSGDPVVLDLAGAAAMAGNIGTLMFDDPAADATGSSDGYVAYTVSTQVDERTAYVSFDIPMPSMFADGQAHKFTLEQMMSDGSLPCVNVYDDGGAGTWADDYLVAVTPVPPDADDTASGDVVIQIVAHVATDGSDVTTALRVPAFTNGN